MPTPTTTTSTEGTCPLSGQPDGRVFVEFEEVPVLCNSLYPDPDRARSARCGDLRLAYFERSGHMYNVAFDAEKITYSETYENSLHHSARFRQYARNLADRLIETYDVRGRHVIDIGCGNAEFLSLLCERGDNNGIGYDPSYPTEASTDDAPFTVIRDLYSEEYSHHPADFVCCRHVLEHVSDPIDFLKTIRQTVGDQPETVVYLEVPNALFTLREVAVWDLIYEHCSYFTPASLAYAARRAGFEVIRTAEAFGGQFLQIELRPGPPVEALDRPEAPTGTTVSDAVDAFAARAETKTEKWRDLFSEVGADDKRAVLWGAGSKGATILNTVPEVAETTEYIVDINPDKQGKYVAGVGHEIVPPTFLREYQPDLVVLMNGMYESEIRGQLAELGLSPEIAVAT